MKTFRRLFGVAACAVLAVLIASPTLVNAASPTESSRAHTVRTDAQTATDNYVLAVANRLNIMPEVAYTKYVQGTPIDDPVREQALIASFVGRAVAAGVPSDVARGVISDQFTASKAVQKRLIHQWTTGGAPLPQHQPLDLVTQIRPMVDKATDELLAQLLAVLPHSKSQSWANHVELGIDRANCVLRSEVSAADLREALHSLAR